ncbi:MAG: hypothetical protein WCZ66_09285 [Sphingomonadaceae bacterium]
MSFDLDQNFLWRLAAAAGGALVSLSLPVHQNLSPGGKIANFFNGFLCAVFLGPLVVHRFFPATEPDSEMMIGGCFVIGMSAMALMPFIIEKLRKVVDGFTWGQEK